MSIKDFYIISLKKIFTGRPGGGAQWAKKGGQKQFPIAKSLLNRDYVHCVGSNEL
jgi:hypothetical protein